MSIKSILKSLCQAFLIVIWFSTNNYAAPDITSITGEVSHKQSIIISGTTFGTKSPAAPRIWDACDADSTNNLNTHWPGGNWPEVCPNATGETPYIVAYRSNYHSMGYPHSNITKYLCAATTTCDFGSGQAWTSGQSGNFFTTTTWNADKLFAMFYYRLSTTFAQENSASTDNLKELSANGSPGSYLAGRDTYFDHVNSQTPPVTNPNNAGMKGYLSYTNPMNDWVHMEYFWDDTSGQRSAYSDGTSTNISSNWWAGSGDPGDEDKLFCRADSSGAGSRVNPTAVSIGGFARFPRLPTTGNYRYWAGLYLDNTYSRVMLGNDATWTNCTIREPQIPVTWSGTSIYVTVNQGALSDGTAYLFVFDSNNDANTTGYAVTVGEGASLSGTAISGGVLESEIVAGGESIIITLTGDYWVATVGADNIITTALINNLDSNRAEPGGWDAQVKTTLAHGDITRTSNTVLTIVLPVVAAYDISQTEEVVTVTIPDIALESGETITATPTFPISVETPDDPPGGGAAASSGTGIRGVYSETGQRWVTRE